MSSQMGGGNNPLTPTVPTTSNAPLSQQQLQQMSQGMRSSSPSSSPSDSWASYDSAIGNTSAPSASSGQNIDSTTGLPIQDNNTDAINTGVGTVASDIGKDIWNTWSNTPSKLSGDISDAANDLNTINQGNKVIPSGEQLKAGGKFLVDGIARPISDVISAVFAPISSTVSQGIVKQNANAISDIPAIQQAMSSKPVNDLANSPTIQKIQSTVSSLVAQHPTIVNGLSSLLNIVMGAGGEAIAPETTGAFKGMVSDSSKVSEPTNTVNMGEPAMPITPKVAPTASLDEQAITDSYTKAIKPSVSGKNTAGQVAQANTKVVSGLQAIHDNAPNLKLTDEDGNEISGSTPQTVGQLSDAIAQTKAQIFQKYNDMQTQAGGAGATVDIKPITSELDNVINNKALNIKDPSVASYASQLKDRLTSAGSLDTQTAQDLVKSFNDDLKAFYRNPTYGAASKAGVDALVANNLRTGLDSTISKISGEGYQDLKNQYGSLSSMESDVAKRVQVLARQAKSGLVGNFSNIASGAELARGLLTGNFVDVGVSGAIKGIQLFQKYLNSPERAIQNIFSEFENSSPKPTESTSPVKQSEISSSKPITVQPKSQGIIQSIKNTPNKQGGMIDFGKIAKALDNRDRSIILDFIAKPTIANMVKAQKIAEAMNLPNATGTNNALKNDFVKVLDADRQIQKTKLK